MNQPSSTAQTAVSGNDDQPLSLPDTDEPNTPWRFYNRLIAEIPDDIVVHDYDLGDNWSYVEADCGMGICYTCKGGSPLTHADDLHELPLRSVAELAKSWNFEEATLGVAALNAWFMRHELLDPLGAEFDPIEQTMYSSREAREHPLCGAENERRRDAFDLYRPLIEAQEDPSVVVVGHFPHVARIADYARLTVLERNCRSAIDTPDPACEYVMPNADFAFITGVTIINKTAPRLLELTRNARTVMLGPSVIASPILFEWGVETLGSRIVEDPEQARYAVKNNAHFGASLRMCTLTCPEARAEIAPEAHTSN